MAEENKNLQRPSFLSPERLFDVGFKDVEIGSEDQTKVNVVAEANLLNPLVQSGMQEIALPSGKTLGIDFDLISGKLNTQMIEGPDFSLGAASATSAASGAGGAGSMMLMNAKIAKELADLKTELEALRLQTTNNLNSVSNNLTSAVTNLMGKQSQDFSEEMEITKKSYHHFFDLRLIQAGNAPTWL